MCKNMGVTQRIAHLGNGSKIMGNYMGGLFGPTESRHC